jgi:hypothetical protein
MCVCVYVCGGSVASGVEQRAAQTVLYLSWPTILFANDFTTGVYLFVCVYVHVRAGVFSRERARGPPPQSSPTLPPARVWPRPSDAVSGDERGPAASAGARPPWGRGQGRV